MAAALVLGVGLLGGCEKPPPSVTAFSGTGSVRVPALCWSFDGEPLTSEQCAEGILSGQQLDEAPELAVTPGNVIGISVDPAVAEEGWYLTAGGQQLAASPITETYFRFTFPQVQVPAEGVPVQVLVGEGTELRGLWAIRLVG